MQRLMDRRRFLARTSAAIGGAAAFFALGPRRSRASALPSGVTPFNPVQPRSPDLAWYALDPEWGAGDAGCPADPTAAHASSHNCHACTACHKHAANKLFATAEAADLHRAHPGCKCEVRVGGTLPDSVWIALFGDPDNPADIDRDSVDRRWDWVQDILSGDGPTCVSDPGDIGATTFEETWRRTDKPVLDGAIARTWMWGPQPYTCAFYEPYADAPGGQRLVQYFDKSRMEDNSWRAPDAPWNVTNGLLVVELISGNRQMGDNTFQNFGSAEVNVAGDANDPNGPTYASFKDHLTATVGFQETAIKRVIHRSGEVTIEDAYGDYGIGAAHFVTETQHWIAEPFWAFMNSSGLVYEGANLVTAPLFVNPYYATGYPITEAYWAIVQVAGTPRAVLVQCFERRVLTYTPGNPPGFVTEAGNVGQHYYAWRYG